MPEIKQLKTLLVDDDKFLLDMYLLKFKKSGLDLDAAPSSQEALKKLREGVAYDIVILDIILPGLDGLELLKIIKEEKLSPKAIIIMLTNQTDDFEKAKLLGVDGYIIKASAIPSEVVEQVLSIYKSRQNKN